MDKRFDIVALGECLIDFVSIDGDDKLKIRLEGNPGGAPANVLAQASKLGGKTAFIGKIGADSFGAVLRKALVGAGIDVSALVVSADDATTLAIVSLDESGNRSFSFYRNRTADILLDEREVNLDIIRDCRIFHFGSVSMTAEPARTATLSAARYARREGAVVSYDPNLRVPLWKDLDEARRVILGGLGLAQLVKLSDDELRFLTGKEDIEEGIASISSSFDFRLLAVTLGPRGCMLRLGGKTYEAPAYPVSPVDTTGAGDSFWGALLSRILSIDKPIESYSDEEIYGVMRFANAAGSLTTTKRGAIPALPDEGAILSLIRETPSC